MRPGGLVMGPPPQQYGLQPPGAGPSMANGPLSGGFMRPPGPPSAGPGMPPATGSLGFSGGYGPVQAAAGMQQMSLGQQGGLGGPPPPPAGVGGPMPPAGPGSAGPRPAGSFGGPPRPVGGPMGGPPSGGFLGGPQAPFPRGPPSGTAAAGGPSAPFGGALGPGPQSAGATQGLAAARPPAAGMPGAPSPLANGPMSMSGPRLQQQQQMPAAAGAAAPFPGMQPPAAAAGGPPNGVISGSMMKPPGSVGPAAAAPPGPASFGQQQPPAAAAAAGGGLGVRPPMPGFMPAGPPGIARPVGLGGPPGGSGMQPSQFGGAPPPGMAQGPPGMPGMPPAGPLGSQMQMRPPGMGIPGAAGMGPPPAGFGTPTPGSAGQMGLGGMGSMGPPSRQAMSGRIDPTQIPRPSAVQQSQEVQVFETRVNGAHVTPPSSISRFVVRDRGNASPRLLRSSLNTVPATTDMLNNSGMQFALAVQPLALPDPDDDPVVVVDLGELGPVRCARCKGYMNPYMRWTDGGKAFACNFCGHTNSCPDVYFCYLGPDNRRRDMYERAELSCGTYEVVATKEYFARPAMPVIHVFLMDVGHAAVASGATAATCQCIEQVLDALQGGDNTLVGIVTFDSNVHFYNVTKDQTQPQMMVMADVADVYAPMSSQLLAKLSDCRGQLAELLSSIPTMFAAAQGPESCAAAAIEACVELLKPTGGKLHAFVASLPNHGSKALKMRDGSATNIGDKEKQQALLAQDNTYYTLASQAADYNVCIDVFLLPQAYIDVATFSSLTNTTGGSLYHYLPFNPLMDQDQLLNDLKWNVSRPQGLEAILRVRCSAGIDVESYVGSFYKPPTSPTDLYLAAIDCDKALVAKLVMTEKLSPNSEVYLQCALLYTTTDGARRIRISTLALPVSDQMGAVFKGADLDTQLASLTRQVAVTLPGGMTGAGKELILARITGILSAYRKYCATSSSSVQLILPEALKLLPLYSLALQKSPLLRPDVRIDERSLWIATMVSASCPRTLGLLHPRLFAVHQLIAAGSMPPAGHLPEQLVLSSEVLDQGGVYLLDNGADLLIYMDQEANDKLVQDVFGMPNMEALLRAPQPLPVIQQDNPASRLLFELLTALRLSRCAFMRLRVAKKGDPYYPLFVNMMVEDRSTAGMSYVEYLCHVHRQIQDKMS